MECRETLAWAAGLFEGEGCFDACAAHAYRPRASMSLTDRDVLARFREAVGCGRIGPAKSRAAHHKPAWQWWTTEAEFRVVVDLLAPWLSRRRLDQAGAAAAARKSYVSEVTKERVCPTCDQRFSPPFSKAARKRRYCDGCCSRGLNRPGKSRPFLAEAA